MEVATMVKGVVSALIENLDDLTDHRKGRRAEPEIRRVDVTDALIDTGATGLLMPSRLIALLGLEPVRARQSRTIAGHVPLANLSGGASYRAGTGLHQRRGRDRR